MRLSRIIFIALLTLSVNQGVAQQLMQYGIKGGLNLSDIVITNYINADVESDFKTKPGLHAGIFATVHISDRIALAPELLYSNKGVTAGNRINLHYISLPLVTQYKVVKKFMVEFGPEIGYLVAARSRLGNVGNTWNNKLDIGLDVGMQCDISETLGLGIRYNAGFSSVIDSIDDTGSNSIPTEETIKYQNRVFQFFIRYTVGERLLD
jgi:hypothetical protein